MEYVIMSRKTFHLVFICLLPFLFFSTFSIAIAGSKDTVKVAMRYDPATVNMLEIKLGNAIPVIVPMQEALMSADAETGERVPILAETLEVMEN